MTKKVSVLLAFVALLFCELALAQGYAVVTSVVGNVNVQTGPAIPRALRMGDQVQQGDTISTGASSSVVLKFEDGEVAALTQNSRMTVTAYQFEPASGSGNMLLSLVTGGMRAITGLLGRSHPERVAYRAATATIGIRGTDVTIVTNGTDTEVHVTEGSVTLTLGGSTVTIKNGETYYVHNGAITTTPPPGFSSTPASELQGMTISLSNAQTETVQTSSGTATVTNIPGSGAGGGTPTASPH